MAFITILAVVFLAMAATRAFEPTGRKSAPRHGLFGTPTATTREVGYVAFGGMGSPCGPERSLIA